MVGARAIRPYDTSRRVGKAARIHHFLVNSGGCAQLIHPTYRPNLCRYLDAAFTVPRQCRVLSGYAMMLLTRPTESHLH